MRQKKIRGHKRRWNHIEDWCRSNSDINLTGYSLYDDGRYYAKIRVHPWSGLSMTNSVIPEPKRKTKLTMLNGLLDIYDNWKNQLDLLGQPYYLKLWLFEPRFSQSQVVCAIGNSIDFYENTFFKPEETKVLHTKNYGEAKSRLDSYTWDYALDEDHYDDAILGEPEMYASIQDYQDSRKWFEQQMKKPHQTHKFDEPIGDSTEFYSFKRGSVWLGEKK